MKPLRFTLYAASPLAGALVGFEHNRSSRINQIAEDYLALISDYCPELSDSEWEMLTIALACNPHFKGTPLRLLWALFLETSPQHEALAQRIRSFDTASLIAFRESLLQRLKKREESVQASDLPTSHGAAISREF